MSYSKYAVLTPDNSVEEGFASATLIDSSNNVISGSQWQCAMPSSGDQMCIYLTINVDLFSIFSFHDNDGTDKFVSFANAWNNDFGTGSESGEVFIAPNCGDSLFEIDNIFTLLM